MADSKILIVGAYGQLGLGLQERFPDAKAVDRDTFDMTDHASVQGYDWSGIETIINAAAYTNVDGAETEEGRVAAWQANAVGVGNLAAIAAKIGATLIHFSSDYVFDGQTFPHTETEPLSPLGVYGQSKAAGDIVVATCPKHYLIRTSWVIGKGKNFVRTMLGLAEKGVSPSVVSDQMGRPTFVGQLVDAVEHLIEAGAEFGVYNVSNDGPVVSWADLAREIFKLGGFKDIQVTDISTKDYNSSKPNIAPRPQHGEFDLGKITATGLNLRNWTEDLSRYLDSERPAN
ncbi:MAG: NAD(P)-dependent oxidoreductase [Candidatus Berkelbacteria bacterium]|nr:NAD(P)-dependent oxidoreductase [Candidatus Berkelbacteria bacterium]MCR4307494.1 NAD(P)-dependent oxidoreductase [Candidatus Berkelbacteria bacterium]